MVPAERDKALRCFAAAAEYFLLILQKYPPGKLVRKLCWFPLFLSCSCKLLFHLPSWHCSGSQVENSGQDVASRS